MLKHFRVILGIVYILVMLVAGVASLLKFSGSETSNAATSLFVKLAPTETLDTIGGLADVKRVLRRSVLLPLKRPELFENPLLRPPRGTLLCGSPGTGKTMLARALAVESGVPFMALHPAVLENKWWGESNKILAAAFASAAKTAPCIMFFDEIDGIGRARSEQDQSCVYSFKCELLRHLDGIETCEAPVIVLACTNCLSSLDPALQRRFGQRIVIPLPDETARLDILRKLTRHETKVPGLRRVAGATAGFSGSDLASAYANASGARLDDVDFETAVQNAQNAQELQQALGLLSWEHWSRGGRLKEKAASVPKPKYQNEKTHE